MDAGKGAAMALERGEGMNKMRCYAMRAGVRGKYIIVRGTEGAISILRLQAASKRGDILGGAIIVYYHLSYLAQSTCVLPRVVGVVVL
jgi:hypothetical protein